MHFIFSAQNKSFAFTRVKATMAAKWPALVCAGIFTMTALNAQAVDTPPLTSAPPATSAVAKPESTPGFKERIERMKSLSPEQRNHERDLILQEMQSMPPEQRAQLRENIRKHWEEMSPAEREKIRSRIKQQWKNISPAQSDQSRVEMREHFKNMSPEERQQFKSDMDLLDGIPQVENHYQVNKDPNHSIPTGR